VAALEIRLGPGQELKPGLKLAGIDQEEDALQAINVSVVGAGVEHGWTGR